MHLARSWRYINNNERVLYFPQECTPDDWKAQPKKISVIEDENCKEFALALNGIWKQLCKKVK